MKMRKQLVNWKPIVSKNIYGEDYLNNAFPSLIARAYRGTLIDTILSMPSKKSISFEAAVNLACDQFHKAADLRKFGYEPGQCFWYHENFVQWISEQGFHIELTGDEFEALALASKVA